MGVERAGLSRWRNRGGARDMDQASTGRQGACGEIEGKGVHYAARHRTTHSYTFGYAYFTVP